MPLLDFCRHTSHRLGLRTQVPDVAALVRRERLAKPGTEKAAKRDRNPTKVDGLLLPWVFCFFFLLNSQSFAAGLLLQQIPEKVNMWSCLFNDEKQELRLRLFGNVAFTRLVYECIRFACLVPLQSSHCDSQRSSMLRLAFLALHEPS